MPHWTTSGVSEMTHSQDQADDFKNESSDSKRNSQLKPVKPETKAIPSDAIHEDEKIA